MTTPIQKQAAVDALKVMNPKEPYGGDLFDALSRLTVTVAVEAVCFRRSTSAKAEVYLVQRPLDVHTYPGQWANPGSIVRPGESIEDVFGRLEKGKGGGKFTTKKFVGNFNNPREPRGHFFCVVHLCTIAGNNLPGQWFPIDELPETVWYHRDHLIPIALGAFEAPG